MVRNMTQELQGRPLDEHASCVIVNISLFRPGYSVLEAGNVPAGDYIVSPGAVYAGGDHNVTAPFFITASAGGVFNFELHR